MTFRLKYGLWATVGFILSPLSWWNDVFVNIPLAYAFSWPFAKLHPSLYLPSFVLGYWLTNITGLTLLHRGVQGVIEKGRSHSLTQDLLISLLYTGLITLFAWLGWLPSPVELLNQ